MAKAPTTPRNQILERLTTNYPDLGLDIEVVHCRNVITPTKQTIPNGYYLKASLAGHTLGATLAETDARFSAGSLRYYGRNQLRIVNGKQRTDIYCQLVWGILLKAREKLGIWLTPELGIWLAPEPDWFSDWRFTTGKLQVPDFSPPTPVIPVRPSMFEAAQAILRGVTA